MGKEQASLFYALDNFEKDMMYDLYKWGLGVPEDVRITADILLKDVAEMKRQVYAHDVEILEAETPVHKA